MKVEVRGRGSTGGIPPLLQTQHIVFSNICSGVFYNTKRLLKLKAVPKPDDAADALAIAICHARSATSLLRRKDPDVKETV